MPSSYERQRERERRAAERAVMQARREREKQILAAEKAAKQRQLELTEKNVERLNRELDAQLHQLRSILPEGLSRKIDPAEIIAGLFNNLAIPYVPAMPEKPDKEKFMSQAPQASTLERITGLGRSKRFRAIEDLNRRYREAVQAYKTAKEKYDSAVQARSQALTAKKRAIEGFIDSLAARNGPVVERFLTAVLDKSPYPLLVGPPEFRLSYTPDVGELVLEYELPAFDVIMPKVKGYKFVKNRNAIEERPFTRNDEKELKELYEDVIAAIALRTIHEVFSADQAGAVQTIVFNGMISTVDKATGRDVRPCLVSVQVSREEFAQVDLKRVDKRACLKYLKAQTSPSSAELVPVKPLVQLVTTDPRFIGEVDVLSNLDTRTNLLEISPGDFEHLIANLFSQMGFKTGTTRITRDQGVDVIAFHEDPIIGGKVIIQAKRYRNTVEVESVRALYGVMQDEGAIKGILVTTSTFGKASREFAKGKPIELIDGNGLLHYLEEHGHKAKIVFPDQG